MSLQDQLTALKNENLEKIPDEISGKMAADLNKLADSGILDNVPKVGENLKEFNLPNHSGTQVSLSELRKKGPVVITFYRGGWCPYCNLELRTLQNSLPEIKAAGATLVAITPEKPDESLSTTERNNLEFEVLTDDQSLYSRELGITFTVSEEIREIYKAFGIDLEKHNGEGEFELPLAATFIVNKAGEIIFSFAHTDYTQRAEPSEILKALNAN